MRFHVKKGQDEKATKHAKIACLRCPSALSFVPESYLAAGFRIGSGRTSFPLGDPDLLTASGVLSRDASGRGPFA